MKHQWNHPDSRTDIFASQLFIVDRWISLGEYEEANETLEDIDADLRATVEVLERREKIYGALGKAGLLEVVRNALARVKC